MRAQYAWRGGFVRIFPSQNSWQKYAQYLELLAEVRVVPRSVHTQTPAPGAGGARAVCVTRRLRAHLPPAELLAEVRAVPRSVHTQTPAPGAGGARAVCVARRLRAHLPLAELLAEVRVVPRSVHTQTPAPGAGGARAVRVARRLRAHLPLAELLVEVRAVPRSVHTQTPAPSAGGARAVCVARRLRAHLPLAELLAEVRVVPRSVHTQTPAPGAGGARAVCVTRRLRAHLPPAELLAEVRAVPRSVHTHTPAPGAGGARAVRTAQRLRADLPLAELLAEVRAVPRSVHTQTPAPGAGGARAVRVARRLRAHLPLAELLAEVRAVLRPGESRRAFGLYLTQVVKRLSCGSDVCAAHAALVLRFLRRASAALRMPYHVQGPPAKMCDKDRCAVVAKQLNDFLYLYCRDADLCADAERRDGCVSNIHFAQFLYSASEADLEDVLLLVLRMENHVAPFLGDARNPYCVDLPAERLQQLQAGPRHALLRLLAALAPVNTRRHRPPPEITKQPVTPAEERHSLHSPVKESLREEKPLGEALKYAHS
ncbi:unnamed protein product [Parnassius apollo]|uniref:(apollo) hypothetical protein n=1 Tax=Parnassius apollo TaxID=110799 RepID=A0A8S3X8B8_PARAO|nr:unnamed protein product [Parnassius apollo]